MSAYIATIPPAIRRKWDALAVPQLCDALLRESAEADRLRSAEDTAEFWRQQAMEMQLQAAEELGMLPGITETCELRLVPKPTFPCADALSLPSAKQAVLTDGPPGGELGESPSSVCTDGGALEEYYEHFAVRFLTSRETY